LKLAGRWVDAKIHGPLRFCAENQRPAISTYHSIVSREKKRSALVLVTYLSCVPGIFANCGSPPIPISAEGTVLTMTFCTLMAAGFGACSAALTHASGPVAGIAAKAAGATVGVNGPLVPGASYQPARVWM
jgi:hypothetical protein